MRVERRKPNEEHRTPPQVGLTANQRLGATLVVAILGTAWMAGLALAVVEVTQRVPIDLEWQAPTLSPAVTSDICLLPIIVRDTCFTDPRPTNQS